MRYLTIATLIILFDSCNQDYGGEEYRIDEYKTNSDLIDAMERIAPNADANYFKIPNSDDYNAIPQDLIIH